MKVVVIDYGIGNLFSVSRALEHCGAQVHITGEGADLDAGERVVLPGVGAFADGMAGLRERGLAEPIRRFAASGRPLLGICLGMQMLSSVSEEFGRHEGLNLIPGRVTAIPPADIEGRPHKVPHVGWSELLRPAGTVWEDSILEGTAEATAMYLVHSFAVVPDDPAHRLAECDYGGHRIVAAIRSGNVSGCQFHPERSGEHGLSVLRKFLERP